MALNSRLAAMNCTPVESHVGKHLREMLGDVGIRAEPFFRRVFASGEPVLNVELIGALPTKPQGGHWVDNLFPMKDSTGRVRQLGAVVVEFPLHVRLDRPQFNVDSSAGPILRSWKEIADYVGTCVKTVQRWEQAYKFPARRLQASKGAAVFAFKTEVEYWMESSTRIGSTRNR
jgi:hypothetical protein